MITPEHNLPLFPKVSILPDNDPFLHESIARKNGYCCIAGVDEVGRGPLAGPVVAAAVILSEGEELAGVKDSKKMSERAREKAFPLINKKAMAVSVGVVSHRTIDKINILNASLEAILTKGVSLNLSFYRFTQKYILTNDALGLGMIGLPGELFFLVQLSPHRQNPLLGNPSCQVPDHLLLFIEEVIQGTLLSTL